MARANTWQNPDNLEVGFGAHSVDVNVGTVHANPGAAIRTLSIAIDGGSLITAAPTALTRKKQAPELPRGSVIIRATLVAKTAWTGTGTITIGTWGNGATPEAVDDADSIDAAVDVDVALAAIGSTVACDGAAVGIAGTKAGVVSNSSVSIQAFATGTVAGTAELLVEYLPPQTAATIAV